MNILEQICEKKKEYIALKKSEKSLDDLKSMIQDQNPPRGFLNNLKSTKKAALIAEVKKASPSKGLISANFNPEEISKIYEQSGAMCISVLTDEPYFQGHDDYLCMVKNAVKLSVLRKDFMIDPYQIYESRALGADCILLIMGALDSNIASKLYNIATDLKMDVLVEIHNAEELEEAKKLNPMMIGVNNRNLKSMKVDINTSFELLKYIPDSIYKISESGISDSNTIKSLQKAGYNGFLVGESLIRQEDIGSAVQKLLDL